MSLPSSGQISFSDVRTENQQTSLSNYWIGGWANGNGFYPYTSGVNYTPINVHSSNSGKYSTTFPFSMSNWYGYNRNLNYACDGTYRDLYFSISPATYCYPSAMIQFDAGTSNATFDIQIQSTISDISMVDWLVVYYGKPWQSNGAGLGGASVIASYNLAGYTTGLNVTISNYNYVYDAGKGQYIYAVIYGQCP